MSDLKKIIKHIDIAYEHTLNTFPYRQDPDKTRKMLEALGKLDDFQNDIEDLYN